MPSKPSKGRCAGCGRLGNVKVIARHTNSCQDFQTLYSTDSTKALDPVSEYVRWDAERNSDAGQQAKEAKIEARRQELVETSMNKFEAVRGRWTGEYYAPEPGKPTPAPPGAPAPGVVYGGPTDPDTVPTAVSRLLKHVFQTGSAPG